MIVNKSVIQQLNPCKDRFDNYLKHYSKKTHTRKQFMGLKNISHSDKLWVAFRLMPKDKVRFAAADIAELVLPIYEAKYPNDNRPRKAIELARSRATANAAAYAANAAAYAADAADAAYAANAAAYAANAAAYAAYAAANAANAAAYAAYAAANAANAVHAAKKEYEKKIRTIVLKYWK